MLDPQIKLWYLGKVNRSLSQQLEDEVPKRLAELLAVPQGRVKVERQPNLRRAKRGDVDLIAYIGDTIFVVEFKTQGDAASTAMAARRTRQFAEQLKKKAILLVAVPYRAD